MEVEIPLTTGDPSAKKNNGRSKDIEHADCFDPFAERKVENPTTDRDTLMHLLKASLGSGILAMPQAFRCVGFGLGIFLTAAVSFICTYCAYILVKSAHVLYYRNRKTQMTYADVAEASLAGGPKPLRKFAKTLRFIVDIGLFMAYFATCSAYAVIVASNIVGVLENYEYPYGIRYIICALFIPFIALSLIKDLKVLTPFSTIANCFMGFSLISIFGYLIYSLSFADDTTDLYTKLEKNRTEFALVGGIEGVPWSSQYPTFFSLTIFAIEAIGVIMPLENKMETPKNFVGPFGVLSKGMTAVTIIYIILGALGYCYDPLGEDSIITLEIPMTKNDLNPLTGLGIAIRLAVGGAVLLTFTLQFFVCLDICWNAIKKRFNEEKAAKNANTILRIGLTVAALSIAVALPQVTPLLGLIGAFCFSILGLLIPVIIESATYWEKDQNRAIRTTKNVVIGILAILALGFGTYSACLEIKKKLL